MAKRDVNATRDMAAPVKEAVKQRERAIMLRHKPYRT